MGISTASGWKKNMKKTCFNVASRERQRWAILDPGHERALYLQHERDNRYSRGIPITLWDCASLHMDAWISRVGFACWNQKQNHQRGIEHLGIYLIYLESACFVKNVVFICSTSPQNRKGIDHFIDSHFSGCFFSIVLVVLICFTYLLKVGDGPQDVDPERSSPARQMKSPEELCLEMLKKDREATWHDLVGEAKKPSGYD